MEPFIALVEQTKSNVKQAENHYRENAMRKVFTAWKRETDAQCRIKIEIVEWFYNRKVAARVFEKWKQMTKEVNLKYQVAIDFNDMKLLDRYFKSWQVRTFEFKAEREKKEELASSHYESKLKARYFCTWKKYLAIAADIKESEKRKDELRQLVQKVIPDFDPKQRGVALED